MTTSGTATFNETVLQIVDTALRNIGQIGQDESTAGAGSLYTNTALSLNALIKAWQAMGLHVWSEEEAILFLQVGQARYLLGGTTTDNCCASDGYSQTTTALAAAAAATTLTLAATSGFAVGRKIGVLLASGTMYWTTITVLNAQVVTLAAGLPGPVNAGALAVAYQTSILRPLKVPRARLLNLTSNLETPLDDPMSRQEYMDLPNKLTPGMPNQFFYAPKLDSGQMYVWPLPLQAIYGLRFTWYRPLYDVTDPTQTVDFPQEWIQPLAWALSEQIGPSFGIEPPLWQMVTTMAACARTMAEGWDRESEPIQFGMSWEA